MKRAEVNLLSDPVKVGLGFEIKPDVFYCCRNAMIVDIFGFVHCIFFYPVKLAGSQGVENPKLADMGKKFCEIQ